MESFELERRVMVDVINSDIQSNDQAEERKRLEKENGDVYDTQELQEKYAVESFMAPLVVVREKATGKLGTLYFQHSPRFYFGWEEE